MKAIILAAGLGSRLGLDIPKPMYKINGKPVLEHNILLLKKYGITDICINLFYKGDVIKDYFNDGSKWGVKINYSLEKELFGTSGDVKNCEWFLEKEPFFVLYGDNYSDIDLSEMLKFHNENKPVSTVALFDPAICLNSGIAGGVVTLDKDNRLLSFTEGKDKSNGYVNAGVYILDYQILDMIPLNVVSDFGRDIFPKLLKQGSLLKGYITNSFILAIDTQDALKMTEQVLNKGEIK
jgi:NDP-sugar pyrophosphorylase family protein